MPNDTKVVLILLMTISSLGLLDMYYRCKRGRVLKRLQKVKNPSKLTKLYIENYKHFFKLNWWHWISVAIFGFSIAGIIIDSY